MVQLCAADMSVLDGPQLTADLEEAGMQGPRPLMRIADLPVPVDTLPMWSQHLYPSGIRQCLGTALFAADGRYLGAINTNSADPRPATEAACMLMARALPWIAHAIDPLRTVVAVARLVGDAGAGVVLTRGGAIVALPDHALLVPGSRVLAAAGARLADGHTLTTFLCPDPGSDSDADPCVGLLRVSAITCPPAPPGHLCAVVLLSPPPHLCGLTRRDLQILGLMVAGWPMTRVGAALGATAHAVTGHIDHILTLLGAPSRQVAAIRALRRGLYIPAEPAAPPRGDSG
ncbi:helix-turn-helix transcriptional regulator [Couchioplanes caeruleus]|uniref:HTH luxR-type domain-containing protein n=2 Tax=Couchioplanes caeruleus TaxID=56438 RepID=A0A1K0FA93_9ACTN|nr:LuxR C-terminal-related transcriptional regulator [Couchioplanes caeruleus]OJF09761.1 hypothetical protein BG844_35830 [Couchioplanes caeruleus subsp. caeruleus]ROP28345.1 regulatory LuxR family protein [Couchioplanes caeruleus]